MYEMEEAFRWIKRDRHPAFSQKRPAFLKMQGETGSRSTASATTREYVWLDDIPLAVVADVDTASPNLLSLS